MFRFSSQLFKDSAKFGGFTCLFSAAYKAFLCILRRNLTLNDKINAPIAGFLSALSVAIESKSRKSLFKILVVSRMLDSILNIAEEKGYIPKYRDARHVIIWVAASTFLICLYAWRQDLLNPGLLKFYIKWSHLSTNDAYHMFVMQANLLKNRTLGY